MMANGSPTERRPARKSSSKVPSVSTLGKARLVAFANLASIMGSAAVHTGKIVTWEEVTASDFKFCPNVDDLTSDSPAPVQADAQGRYSVPVPGTWTEI